MCCFSIQYTEGSVVVFACVASCIFRGKSPGNTVASQNVLEQKCSCLQMHIYAHTDITTDTQTQTLQGMHRSASHKPYHDVR